MELHMLERAPVGRFRAVRMCRHPRDGESIEVLGDRDTEAQARTLAVAHGAECVDKTYCVFGIFSDTKPVWLQRPGWPNSRWSGYELSKAHDDMEEAG
jgi:hypothetical protein